MYLVLPLSNVEWDRHTPTEPVDRYGNGALGRIVREALDCVVDHDGLGQQSSEDDQENAQRQHHVVVVVFKPHSCDSKPDWHDDDRETQAVKTEFRRPYALLVALANPQGKSIVPKRAEGLSR